LFAVLSAAAMLVYAPVIRAAPQEPGTSPPLSFERIKEGLDRPPPPKLRPAVPVRFPPTFKSRVDRRAFVPTLEEHLHKEFDLNLLQRQSAEWASKCCGLDIGWLARHVEKALRERTIRKTREQIARELAELNKRRAEQAQTK
jgi:hypothetical protein